MTPLLNFTKAAGYLASHLNRDDSLQRACGADGALNRTSLDWNGKILFLKTSIGSCEVNVGRQEGHKEETNGQIFEIPVELHG